MALTYVTHTGDGSTLSFSYSALASKLLSTDYSPVSAQLVVYVDGQLQTLTSDYTIDTGDEDIDFVSAPADEAVVKIAREMDREALAFEWQDVSTLTAANLSVADKQLFYLMQEIIDDVDDSLRKDEAGIWDATSIRIQNVATGTESTDAVNVAQLNAAVSGVLPATVSGWDEFTATGDGTEDTYVITGGPNNRDEYAYKVSINGVDQDRFTHWTITPGEPDTIVLDSVLPNGSDLKVEWITGVVSASLADGTVDNAALADASITAAKLDGTEGTVDMVPMTDGTDVTWTQLTPDHVYGFNTEVRTNRLNEMAVPNGDVNIGTRKLTNVATPTTSTDGANKAYVDAALLADRVYNNLAFGVGESSKTITTTFEPYILIASSESGSTDWGHAFVFPANGTAYVITYGGIDYTFTRATSTTVTVTRSVTSATYNIRTIVMKGPA